jgi:hypothetical protein
LAQLLKSSLAMLVPYGAACAVAAQARAMDRHCRVVRMMRDMVLSLWWELMTFSSSGRKGAARLLARMLRR